MKKRITVFTPTYNRAYILDDLYRSLKRQSFSDFEWLIVDDGSSDNTFEVVDKWRKEESTFSIRYYKTQNGGKHRAVNKGVDLAEGEIFFVLDSDDYLTDDALEKVDRWFSEIAEDSSIKGIVANKGFSKQETVNPLFSEKYIDISFLDAMQFQENGKDVLGGERAIAFYTDYHRAYKYPEIEKEKFITEAVVYYRMANDQFKMRYYNDIIGIIQYLDDGLTSMGSRLYIRNPQGYGLFLRERASFAHYSIPQKLRMWYSYYCEMAFCEEEYRLTKREIAEYVGAPLWAIYSAAALHRVKTFLRG